MGMIDRMEACRLPRPGGGHRIGAKPPSRPKGNRSNATNEYRHE